MSPFEIAVRKELRALWPAWTVAAVSVGAVARLSNSRDSELGWVVAFVGAATLAGQSIGHEYTNGTLPILLAQPVQRGRLLLVKGVAAVPLIVALLLVAIAVLPATGNRGPSAWPVLALLSGLAAAPWLTMVCRGPLAGVLFASSLTATAHIAAEVALFLRYGSIDDRATEQAAFRTAVLVTGLALGTVVAAVAGWRSFMRLEAPSGPASGIDLDRWWPTRGSAAALPPARSARRHPLWLLALKELRLQQLTLVVTPMVAVGWVTVALLWRSDPEASEILYAVGLVYYGSLAVLIGSLASAEERRLGTHEWQTLLPLATWQQWSVKLAIVLSLALIVSVGVPTLLAVGEIGIRAGHIGVIALMAVGSLYISSLCRSGLHALAWSVPVLFVALSLLGSRLGPMLFTNELVLAGALTAAGTAAAWFGFENHRTTKTAVSRVSWQAFGIAAGPLVAAIIGQWPR